MIAHQRFASSSLFVVLLLLPPRLLAPAVIEVDGTLCNINAAIQAANDDAVRGLCPAGSGPDTIRLLASDTLTLADNSTDGPNALPSVTSTITIEGNGYYVHRQPLVGYFRLFHVGASGSLTLKDLTIRHGITDSGGGIFNRGRLVLRNTTVGQSRAQGGSPAFGGGIYNLGYTRIVDSTISDCWAKDRVAGPYYTHGHAYGGGIYSGPGTVLKIENSTIQNNRAHGGLSLSDERAYGGGVRATGYLAISYSTIADNEAHGSRTLGGGISADTAAIRNSTISGNIALVYGTRGAIGGGIHANSLELINSTISGNYARTGGGGVVANGTVERSTFLWNESASGASVYGRATGVSLTGSIFAERIDGDHCNGNVSDAGGGNLADDATCVGSFGSLIGIDSALALNGGPTRTHRLLPGSTAIDPLPGGCGLGTDQRGAGRMESCDSGAYEYLGDGCNLAAYSNATVDYQASSQMCHTALVGPNFIVDGPTGDWTLSAGFLVNVRDGFEVRNGGEFEVGIDPSLLP